MVLRDGGSGSVNINGQNYTQYFSVLQDRLASAFFFFFLNSFCSHRTLSLSPCELITQLRGSMSAASYARILRLLLSQAFLLICGSKRNYPTTSLEMQNSWEFSKLEHVNGNLWEHTRNLNILGMFHVIAYDCVVSSSRLSSLGFVCTESS